MPFYIGAAKPLAAAELTALAQKHGVEERALRAVIAVEAAGKAFQSSGALTCLYEPHIAYRYATGAARDALVNTGLAYKKWGTKPYPSSSYSRIDRCSKIAGEEIAALATSWGAPQMMGFNHSVCGYPSAVQMVKAFAASEAAQIEAMIRFIKANAKMFAALKVRDWPAFASHYNGSGYKQNGYDTKLKAAYAKAPASVKAPPVTTPEPSIPKASEPKTTSQVTTPTPAQTPASSKSGLATILSLIANLFKRSN